MNSLVERFVQLRQGVLGKPEKGQVEEARAESLEVYVV